MNETQDEGILDEIRNFFVKNSVKESSNDPKSSSGN